MSRCAFFVSAPTVRFLRAMKQVSLLAAAQRWKIAIDVSSQIKSLVGSRDIDELRRCAQMAQGERWRLISSGIREMIDPRFARTAIAEQWLLARIELVHPTSPVAEILAERRCRIVEDFLLDNLSFETGEVIQLHSHAPASTTPRVDASRTAAA